jgi:hypothetical protein
MRYNATAMEWAVLLALAVVLIAAVAAVRPGRARGGPLREGYGPPPGMRRALHHEELGDRGWPSYPYEYTANTASSISHMIERSA